MTFTKEYNDKLIDSCKQMIAVTDTPIYFGSPIIVKTSPHTELYRCYGCVVTVTGELKLMNPEQEWDDIKPAQANAGYVLQSLYQRLKSIQRVSA